MLLSVLTQDRKVLAFGGLDFQLAPIKKAKAWHP
jgi:hypothetical protein